MSKELWYFYADWCPYCQQQNPIMDEYAANNPDVEIIRINEADDKDAIEHNRIQSYPTMFPFKDGMGLEHRSGVQSLEKLQEIFS